MNLHHYCKIGKYIILVVLVRFFSFFINLNIGESYYFGLKSADNTPENIGRIESSLNVKLPVVSFIFDPRDESDVLNSIDRIVDLLGTDRIYHFTISPDMYSANDVIEGKFDAQYMAFFEKVKEKNLHVIFRTMHEMNGGWYPWSSNPETFKEAWIHVRTLSRLVGLDEGNILFDFSVNHRDMPTKGTPSQSASLIQCNQSRDDCYHFEDYYPGYEYVDVVGFTFYNRGKANSNRLRLTPKQILYDKNWNTYERIKAFGKPVIIDEVATTSVRYDGEYSYEKSRNEYLNHDERKDAWIYQLWEFLVERPEIMAVVYFNTDYTHGLQFRVVGEADWALVNLEDDKIYGGFNELELFGEKKLDNMLVDIFRLKKYTVEGKDVFIQQRCKTELSTILLALYKKATLEDKVAYINKLKGNTHKSECIDKSLKVLSEVYDGK